MGHRVQDCFEQGGSGCWLARHPPRWQRDSGARIREPGLRSQRTLSSLGTSFSGHCTCRGADRLAPRHHCTRFNDRLEKLGNQGETPPRGPARHCKRVCMVMAVHRKRRRTCGSESDTWVKAHVYRMVGWSLVGSPTSAEARPSLRDDFIGVGCPADRIRFLAGNEGHDGTLKDRDRCCAATRVEAPLARKIDPRDFGRTMHARPR
jgi:hypothetical protein